MEHRCQLDSKQMNFHSNVMLPKHFPLDKNIQHYINHYKCYCSVELNCQMILHYKRPSIHFDSSDQLHNA